MSRAWIQAAVHDVDREARPDPTTGGPALIVEVGLAASSAEALAACERLVRADPEVRELESRPSEAQTGRPRRKIRAVLEERG